MLFLSFRMPSWTAHLPRWCAPSSHRLHVLNNLLACMDANDIISFSRHYPNTTGGVQGGRATFRDSRGKGNTFLTCNPTVS